MATTMSRYEELLRLRRQKPFRPYTIHTNDGKSFRVIDFARMGTNGTNVTVIEKGDVISHFKVKDIKAIKETTPRKRN